ncbi:hypothetical protein [Salinisphaera sp. T31B1]|uniref:hypothetical protein n=1 Tax=Salinisphaera sp. T31B1 TaxID=727963 RepID=UPI00333EA1D1
MARGIGKFAAPGAAAALLAAGAVFLWPAAPPLASKPLATSAKPASRPAPTLTEHVIAVPNKARYRQPIGLDLRMDEALSTVAEDDTGSAATSGDRLAKNDTRRSKPASAEPALIVQEPLNLRVPELEADTIVEDELASANKPRDENVDDELAESLPSSRLDLRSRPAPAAPKVTSYSLFNPEYGLRGFMKQGWVSSNLGFQGGLGFNDGRRIQTEDGDLRDDIAVGMGVILAF